MSFKNLFDPRSPFSLNQKFREKRFQFFIKQLNKIKSNTPIEILDIGGTQSYWERMNFTENKNIKITLLNLEKQPTTNSNFSSIVGNACDLSGINDKQYDVVFSNSVIEHLFSLENQKKMASEVIRVGKYYYIQTPNYYFPIEPHWLFPFYQFLPFSLKVFLTRHFSLGHHPKLKDKYQATKRVEEVKLLSEVKMISLFPCGKLQREYFLGLTKSLTMYKFPK